MAETDPGILAGLPLVTERAIEGTDQLDTALCESTEPFVVRGLAKTWPLVAAGLRSAGEARRYLLAHHRDVPFPVSVGRPDGGERLFYNDAMGMNFVMSRGRLNDIFASLEAVEKTGEQRAIYLASIDIAQFFPGLAAENPLTLGNRQPLESIWIGSRTRIAAHNDVPDNLAVCAVGRRRFTLFPPEQFANLYLGPLENTPAGRPVSMVDLSAPDFAAFPRFREALAQARVAELEPGDALFIPSLWWHHVEGLAAFNVLVNYWWRDAPGFLGKPEDALFHAILAIRDLPDEDKRRWRDLFDHYVFDDGANTHEHLPVKARGILAPLTAETAGQIRAKLLRSLSR